MVRSWGCIVFLTFGFFAASSVFVSSTFGQSAAQQPSLAENAAALQALITDDTQSVGRLNCEKIDLDGLAQTAAELFAGTFKNEAEKVGAQMMVQMVVEKIKLKLDDFTTHGGREIYLLGELGGGFLAVPNIGKTAEQLAAVTGLFDTFLPDNTSFQRFGFLIVTPTGIPSAAVQSRFTAPNTTPRPEILAALTGSETEALVTVYPSVAALLPPEAAMVLSQNLRWGVLSVTLDRTPKLTARLETANAEAARDFISMIDVLMTQPVTEMNSLKGMMKAQMEAVGAGDQFVKQERLIDSLYATYKPTVQGNQAVMTIDLIPTIQKVMALFPPTTAGTNSGGGPSATSSQLDDPFAP